MKSDDPHLAVLAAHPRLAERWGEMASAVWEHESVSHGVLELCRIRVAQLLGVDWAVDYRTPGVDVLEAKTRSVGAWPTADALNDFEQTCLEIAELFVVDAHTLTDEQIAAVSDRVGPAGLIQLTTALAVWDGIYRASLTLAPPACDPACD